MKNSPQSQQLNSQQLIQSALNQFHYSSYEDFYPKLINSKDIGQLFYYISMAYNIPLSSYQQKHFDLIFSCNRGGHYIIGSCSYCGKRTFLRTPCNSFFCRECRNYLTGKVKRNAKKYLWDCNHFFATFTLPPEIQKFVRSWYALKSKKVYLNKESVLKEKKTYFTDLIYKSVDNSIKTYCKKHNLKTGYILMPHSYGSENLNWFFHLNALISSNAFDTSTLKKSVNKKIKKLQAEKKVSILKIKQEIKISSERISYLKSCKNLLLNDYKKGFFKLFLQNIYKQVRNKYIVQIINSRLNKQKLITTLKETNKDYSSKIKNLKDSLKNYEPEKDKHRIKGYQFDYNELRAIYKSELEKNFNVSIKNNPQIKFAEKRNKITGEKSIYIPYQKSINIILDYFRHLPLSIKNIIKIEGNFIWYQTSKQKQKGLMNKCSLPDFFKLIMQHIPPSHFRTIRQFGLYSNHNKKRCDYPTQQPKQPLSLTCEDCNTPIDKNDFVGRVHNGVLIWLNPMKISSSSIFFCKRNSMLDYKDFEVQPFPEIDINGRLKEPIIPPPDLKPPSKPKFPERNKDFDYLGVGNNE